MSKEIVKYLYFNLSGVYNGKSPMVDLTDIPGTNCYLDDAAKQEIEHRISSFEKIQPVRFIDSGNYHYMSLFFMKKITVPFTLLLLDNHPDTKAPVFGDITSCGGWVREAAETITELQSVVMAGIDPALIEEESPLPQKCVSAPLNDAASAIADTGLPVYISLDKDIMNRDFARTDWSQGPYTFNEIFSVIRQIHGKNTVIGFDICGEKKEDPSDEDLLINESTNQKIQVEFLRACT